MNIIGIPTIISISVAIISIVVDIVLVCVILSQNIKINKNQPIACLICWTIHFNHQRKKSIKDFYEDKHQKLLEGIKKNDFISEESMLIFFDPKYRPLITKTIQIINNKNFARKEIKKWNLEKIWMMCSHSCLFLYLFKGYANKLEEGSLLNLEEIKKSKKKVEKYVDDWNRIYENEVKP